MNWPRKIGAENPKMLRVSNLTLFYTYQTFMLHEQHH